MAIGIVAKTLTAGSLQPGAGGFTTKVELGMMRQQTGAQSAGAVELSAADPWYGGSTRQARTIYVWHEITHTSAATYESNLALVKKLYDPRHGEQTFTFEVDGVECSARVKLLRIVPGSESRRGPVKGEWQIYSLIYHATAASGSSGPTSKSALPAQLSVTNAGNVLTTSVTHLLKPTSAKAASAGQRYRLPVTIANKAPRGGLHPIEVTGGGWDHAAEVTATRSRSDGTDVEVYIHHKRQMRWAGATTAAFNQAATKVWCNLELEAERHWTIAADIVAGTTTITVDEMPANMPAAPFWAICDGLTKEPVLVTAYDAAARTLTVTRGQRGVTAVSHLADVVIYQATAVDIVYGWTSSNPTVDYIDDRFKPLAAETAASVNASWVYTYLMQSSASGLISQPYPRPGTWRIKPMTDIDRKDQFRKFLPWTATLGTNANPATDMALGYLKAGATAGQPLTEAWVLSTVLGMTSVAYRHVTTTLTMGPGSPPQEGRLETWAVFTDGTRQRMRTADGTAATAVTDTFSVLPALEFGFYVHPWDPTNTEYNSNDGVAALEPTDNNGLLVDDVTVAFASAEQPIVKAGSRQDVYQFGRENDPATLLTRDADSNEIVMYLYGPVVKLNDTYTVDVLARTVELDTGEGYANTWGGELPGVQSGAVTVEYNDDAIGAVTMTTTPKSAYM